MSMGDNSPGAEIARSIREARTQYNTDKTAEQEVVWAIDPSSPLSRQREVWRSNGSLFDSTLFVNGDGETEINLTATGADTARVKSAFVGQYVSHCLSEPGVGISVDSANVQFTNDEVSLDHGLIQFGPFFHDGSAGVNAAGVTDGFGIEVNDTEALFFARANSTHVGGSPIPQGSWNINRVNSPDDRLDISLQTVFNFAYGFYNALPVTASRVKTFEKKDERRVRQQKFHSEEPQGSPLLHIPNLPVQVFASNEGTATALNLGVGGMQYARYGAVSPQFRTTTDTRITTGGTFTATVAQGTAPDPSNESGDAFFAYQRESGAKDLTMKDKEVIIDPDADIYIFFWDEWDPGTALDGTFDEPSGTETAGGTDTTADESQLQTNTTCTSYTPTIANFRGLKRATAGQNNSIDPQQATIDDRVPNEATRVWTLATRDGSASVDLDYFEGEVEEAY